MRTITVLALFLLATASQAIDPKVLKPGLEAIYRANNRDPVRTVYRLDSTPSVSAFDGTIVWVGTLYIVTPGEYVFTANVRDAQIESTLTLNEKTFPILKGEVGNTKQLDGKKIALPAGIHLFKLTLNSTNSPHATSHVELLWEGPGFGREPIPYFFFGHVANIDESKSRAESRKKEFGQFLLEERNCKSCHKTVGEATKPTGPILTDIGRRVYPGWLDAWLADPAKLRPHTTMPKLFGDDNRGTAERYAVTQYLMSLGGPFNSREGKDDPAAAKRGEKHFTLTGCAACHANKPNDSTRIRTDDDDPLPPYDPVGSILGHGTPTGPQSTYALGAVGSKTNAARLTEYLLDPMKSNPHGRMPNMALSQTEARELALYLTKEKDAKINPAMPAEPKSAPGDLTAAKDVKNLDSLDRSKQWREVGKVLMTQKGCVNCHSVKDGDVSLKSNSYLSLETVSQKTQSGCVSINPDPSKHAAYGFTQSERDALSIALTQGKGEQPPPPLPGASARLTMKRLMCLNCHTRDGEGGLAAELADKMKALESAENADDVRPPSLTHIGHKATTEWLRDVLVNKGRARPWMGMRMPQYGEANVGHLVEGLPKLEGLGSEKAEIAKPAFDPAFVAAGRTLTGKDGYGCIACHDISGVTSGGTRGPDLAMTQSRVRPEWFERWMHNPHRMSPGTKMPQYFLDGKATNALLNADPKKQVDAFRAYYSLGMGLPLPTGLEPPKGVVIAVKDRPQLIRTFMPEGAGTRSFAVGYPGNVNLAYDGTQARVAYAWAGNFLDASPVWTNRGGNPAKLLGPKFWTAPAGHPWAMGTEIPDFAKRATDPAYGADPAEGKAFNGTPLLTFDGYSIDEKGNPTFKSTLRTTDGQTLTVSETPLPLTSHVATGFARQFEINAPEKQTTWLLAGTGTGDPRLLEPGSEGMATYRGTKAMMAPTVGRLVLPQPGDRAIVLTVPQTPAPATWRLVPGPGGVWQAMLSLPPGTGKADVTVNTWAVAKDDDKLIRELK